MSSPLLPHSFTHLHVHSTYSDGLATPLQLARQAALLGFTHLALTDHNTLTGHPAFISACAIYHLTPLLGVEIRVHTNEDYGHNVVLARTPQEYHYLQWLLSRRKKVQLGELRGAGLVTSGCLGGVVAKALVKRDTWKAVDYVRLYHDTFGPDYLLEVQPNFQQILPWMLSFGRHEGIPVVVTNDVHYLLPSDSYRHVNAGLHLASATEMAGKCGLAGYQEGILQTNRVACAVRGAEQDVA